MTLDGAAAAIAGRLDVRAGRVHARDQSFYDTFDGLVRSSGRSVVHENGHLILTGSDSDEAHMSEPMRRPARPLPVGALPPGRLRDALTPITGVRALLPLVRINSRERALDVLDDEDKTVVRMTLSAPAVLAPDRSVVLLAPRARLAPVRGYGAELERVRGALVEELGFSPVSRSVADEALAALGLRQAPVALSEGLRRGQPAGQAVGLVLERLLAVVRANLPGTLADIDTEFLHDVRVSVRRARAVARELGAVFEPAELAHLRDGLRWIQGATGPTRDLDIWALEFEGHRELIAAELRPELDPLLEVLLRHRRHAFLAMRRALRSERTERILAAWAAASDGLAGGDQARAGQPTIEEAAGARIRKLHARMVKAGSAIDADSPPEDLHELRKQGKELRYVLELFGPLFEDELTRRLVKRLKSLQDVLGRHQDRSVQVSMLRSLRDEVARQPGGAGALVAMGALTQRLREDEQLARAEFAERFHTFASPRQRRLVRRSLS